MASTPDYDYLVLDRMLDQVKSELFQSKNAGFLGPLMCALNFVWDSTIETCDTDGSQIRWNPKDFLGCTFDGRVSSLLHELGHVYRLHNLRREERDLEEWNIACDIVINRDLINMGFKLEWASPGIGSHPEIPHELEEHIYDYLVKQKSQGNKPSGNCCGGLPTLSGQQAQSMINNVMTAVHSAHQLKAAGSIPGNVELILEKFLKPKLPWERLLYLWFNDMFEEEYDWNIPDRRYLEQELYLPALIDNDGRLEHLIYYFDTSGSVSDKMLIRFNSEVKYIKDRFDPQKLTLVLFDTRIHAEYTYNETDKFTKLKVIGRGGTSLHPVREHMMEHKPTAAIVFSDLFCTEMAAGPKCPILWVACNNPDATVPFGKLIHLKE